MALEFNYIYKINILPDSLYVVNPFYLYCLHVVV